MKRPRVSVVMPVFNSGTWLKVAIDSICRQSLTEFEFIIVDDGSTDESDRIIAAATRNDSRIYMIQTGHRGLSLALNTGIARSRSPYIARMDADDIAHPERLERQLDFLEQHVWIAALGSWAYVINQEGDRIGELRPPTEPDDLRRLLTRQNPFIHSSMVLSTDLIRRLDGYRPLLDGAEDFDLWLRLSEHAQLANLPEFLLSHRRHLGSESATSNTKQLLAARLARISATQRRKSKSDLVDNLNLPINLSKLSDDPVFGNTATFFSLLGRAPDSTIKSRSLFCFWTLDLNHAERKAAQFWLRDVLESNEQFSLRVIALLWLLYLHPPRGLALVWSVFSRKLPSL